VFPKLFHFFNKFVSATLERDGHETDKRLTFSISLIRIKEIVVTRYEIGVAGRGHDSSI
jgi:hypothetical protein